MRRRHGAGEQARAANLTMYGDGHRVADYAAGDYHRLRQELVTELVAALMPAPAGPVLEVGAGSSGPRLRDVHTVRADIAPGALAPPVAGSPAVCLDASAGLPFTGGSFGAVVVCELIEHLFDPLDLLRECCRVLRPGGVLVVSTPNLATAQDRLRFMFGRAPRQVDPLHPYLRLHIRPFTLSSLRTALAAAGLQPVTARSNLVGWRSASGRWRESRTLARWAPGLGGSLVVASRRLP